MHGGALGDAVRVAELGLVARLAVRVHLDAIRRKLPPCDVLVLDLVRRIGGLVLGGLVLLVVVPLGRGVARDPRTAPLGAVLVRRSQK